MKRFITIVTLITLSLIIQAQTRDDFFSFVNSYNWKLSKEQFEEKYASRILPKTDSIVISCTSENPFFVLDDLCIGEFDCITYVIFGDESSSPVITAYIPPHVTKQHLQSIVATKLHKILIGKLGEPDYNMNDVDLAETRFNAIEKVRGNVNIWFNDEVTFFSIKTIYETYLVCMLATQDDKPPFLIKNPAQDTFFGLKMRDKITSEQIKNAVGSRGVFYKELQESNIIANSFTDVDFAGIKWDFASFNSTSERIFYRFCAIKCIDDEKEARSQYEGLKRRLDEKYGSSEEYKDDAETFETGYLGSNDICIILSNKKPNSLGDSYVLTLEYVNMQLYNSIKAQNDDEL